MNKRLTNHQKWSFFFMNVSAFAIIFILLGWIIIHLLNQTAYQETDQSLVAMRHNDEMIAQEISRYQEDNPFLPFGETRMAPPQSPSSNRFNTQIILWSEQGDILNKDGLGGRFTELENLRLSTSELDTIQTLSVQVTESENLNFRSITFESTDSAVSYIQIVSNINQIDYSLRHFQWIVIITMIIFWLITIAISYWLSSKSMQPILATWQKHQEFVENASHELRTPLTIIQNRLEGMLRKPNNTILDEAEKIAQALNETRRLVGLTQDLLTLAQNEGDRYITQREKIDISLFLNEIAQPFAQSAQLEGKVFSLDILPNLTANLNPGQLTQVIMILLDNALKYTNSGDTIELTANQEGHFIIIHIKNTGPSIAPDAKKHLFDRFYREDKSRSKETGGYGLGLAIAKQIVENYGGSITVDDVVPHGADFHVRIPCDLSN